jgi:hypothetical protein
MSMIALANDVMLAPSFLLSLSAASILHPSQIWSRTAPTLILLVSISSLVKAVVGTDVHCHPCHISNPLHNCSVYYLFEYSLKQLNFALIL